MRARVFYDVCRTAFAVCALYALALQGFAGALAQAESGVAPLCAHGGSGPQPPSQPGEHRALCCTMACMAGAAAAGPAMPVPAGPGAFSTLDWRPESRAASSVATLLAFRARGPPSA